MDIGPRIIDGEWTIMARDDSVSPPVWRYPEDVVVHLGSDSLLAMPDDEEFAFIPAEPGGDLYVIPQTQLTEVAWLGWNTQDPNVVEQIAGGATLRFHGYEGLGGFTIFLQNGNFPPPTLLWDGDNPEPQDIWAEANTHVHANWIFTHPGIYYLDIEVLATLNDGTEVSDRDVVAVAVGDETDPEAAFAAAEQRRQDERKDPEEAASLGAETIPEDQTATNDEAPSGVEDSPNERAMGDEKVLRMLPKGRVKPSLRQMQRTQLREAGRKMGTHSRRVSLSVPLSASSFWSGHFTDSSGPAGHGTRSWITARDARPVRIGNCDDGARH